MRWMLMALATIMLINPVMAQQDQSRPETAPQAQTSPPALDRRDQIRSELRNRIMQRFEQRLADFKSSLRLTPEQEANWSAFESGAHDFVRLRAEQVSTMQEELPTTSVERLRQRAEQLASTSSALKHLADVEEALYTKLTDAQKDRFRDMDRLIRRPAAELEDREQASERDEAQERDSDSRRDRHPMWRRHMRDEDDEDWRERHHMMRRYHNWDDDDEDSRDRRGMWRDRGHRYNDYEGNMQHRWRDDCHRSWIDRD